MTEKQVLEQMRAIERRLMRLSNNSRGNYAACDAVLKAQAALYDFRQSTGAADAR